VEGNVRKIRKGAPPMDDQQELEKLGNIGIRIDKAIRMMLDDRTDAEAVSDMKTLSRAAAMCPTFWMMTEARIRAAKSGEDIKDVFSAALIIGMQIGLNMAEIERPRPRFVS
jgi:hypothetical protein